MDPTPIVTNPQDETKQTINEISLPKDFDPTLIVTNPQKKKDEYLRTLAEIAISVKTIHYLSLPVLLVYLNFDISRFYLPIIIIILFVTDISDIRYIIQKTRYSSVIKMRNYFFMLENFSVLILKVPRKIINIRII